MKRITTAVLAGATVATLAYASASLLEVDSKPIQAGFDTVSCDTDGVDVGWGFESDSSTVSSVTVRDIASECVGYKMFVDVNGERVGGNSIPITGDSISIKFDPVRTVKSIDNIRVQIG